MLEKFAVCEARKVEVVSADRFKGMMTYVVALGLLYLIVSRNSIRANIDDKELTLAGDFFGRLLTLCWPFSI